MVETDYQCGQVVLSFALSFISSYNAVCLADIHRHAPHFSPKYFPASIQLIFMSMAIGGGAIWSMHFTGMTALILETDSGSHIPLDFNIGTTILSLLVAIAFVYVGLLISTLDRVYTKSKDQIFEMILSDLSRQSRQDVPALYRLALLKGLDYLLIGGVVTGGGVCVMHYIGMLALDSNSHLKIEWNAGLVCLSVIIAIVASTAAFWILFRLLPLFPSWESLRLASSFIMALAVCGMHYTGMVAASFHANASHPSGIYFGHRSIDSSTAGLVAVVFSMILNWSFSMVIQSELRYLSFTRSRELEQVQKKLVSSDKVNKQLSRYYSEGDGLSHAPPNELTAGLSRKYLGTAAPVVPVDTSGDVAQAVSRSLIKDVESL